MNIHSTPSCAPHPRTHQSLVAIASHPSPRHVHPVGGAVRRSVPRTCDIPELKNEGVRGEYATSESNTRVSGPVSGRAVYVIVTSRRDWGQWARR